MPIYENATLVKRIYDGSNEVLEKFDGPNKIYPTPSTNDVVTTTTSCVVASLSCSILSDHGDSAVVACTQLPDLITWSYDWGAGTSDSNLTACTPFDNGCYTPAHDGNLKQTCADQANKFCKTVDWDTGTWTFGLKQNQCTNSDPGGCTTCAPLGAEDRGNIKQTCYDDTTYYCTTVEWNTGTDVTGLTTCSEAGSEYCSDGTIWTYYGTTLPPGETALPSQDNPEGTFCTGTYWASWNFKYYYCSAANTDCTDLNNVKYTCTDEAGTYCTGVGWSSVTISDDYLTSCSDSIEACSVCGDLDNDSYECVDMAETYCSDWTLGASEYTIGAYYAATDNCNSCADGAAGTLSVISSVWDHATTSCVMHWDAYVYSQKSYASTYTANCSSCGDDGNSKRTQGTYVPGYCTMHWDSPTTSNVSSCTPATPSCSDCGDDGNTKVTCGTYVPGSCSTAGWSGGTSSYVTSCTASGSCSCSLLGNTGTTCTWSTSIGSCYSKGTYRGIMTEASCLAMPLPLWNPGAYIKYTGRTCVQTSGGSGYYPKSTYNCDTTTTYSGYYPTYTYNCDTTSSNTTNYYNTERKPCEEVLTNYQEKEHKTCDETSNNFYQTKKTQTCVQATQLVHKKKLTQTCILDTEEFYQSSMLYFCNATSTSTDQWSRTTRTCTILEAT